MVLSLAFYYNWMAEIIHTSDGINKHNCVINRIPHDGEAQTEQWNEDDVQQKNTTGQCLQRPAKGKKGLEEPEKGTNN